MQLGWSDEIQKHSSLTVSHANESHAQGLVVDKVTRRPMSVGDSWMVKHYHILSLASQEAKQYN
jgi:1,2-phenylacetyl-CoA epoxidase PaaB subunit